METFTPKIEQREPEEEVDATGLVQRKPERVETVTVESGLTPTQIQRLRDLESENKLSIRKGLVGRSDVRSDMPDESQSKPIDREKTADTSAVNPVVSPEWASV